jgi:hypothetical protein
VEKEAEGGKEEQQKEGWKEGEREREKKKRRKEKEQGKRGQKDLKVGVGRSEGGERASQSKEKLEKDGNEQNFKGLENEREKWMVIGTRYSHEKGKFQIEKKQDMFRKIGLI